MFPQLRGEGRRGEGGHREESSRLKEVLVVI